MPVIPMTGMSLSLQTVLRRIPDLGPWSSTGRPPFTLKQCPVHFYRAFFKHEAVEDVTNCIPGVS